MTATYKLNLENTGLDTDAQVERMVELMQADGYAVAFTRDFGAIQCDGVECPVSDTQWQEYLVAASSEGAELVMPSAFLAVHSLESLVDEINTADNGIAVAGYYAWQAASEAGYTHDDDMDAHLDFLAGAGAEFDQPAALKIAAAWREQEAA